MLTLRRAADRGHARLDWLNSYHTFSFGEYYDPRYMGVSNLRVINDDTVAPSGGFATHGHRDMEIVSYVLSGALEHKDSLGNGSVIRPGDVQRISAGRGVLHSEYNPSDSEPVHFLQIWLQPDRQGGTPGYAQRHFPAAERRGKLRLLVSPDGRDESLDAHQPGFLYGSLLADGEQVTHRLAADRVGYVHVAQGAVNVEGKGLVDGDGAVVTPGSAITLEGVAAQPANILLFDLPG